MNFVGLFYVRGVCLSVFSSLLLKFILLDLVLNLSFSIRLHVISSASIDYGI